jgi:hypothetical protein
MSLVALSRDAPLDLWHPVAFAIGVDGRPGRALVAARR